MTQQNSPGSPKNSAAMWWTIATWVVYGTIMALGSNCALIGLIAGASFAVGTILMFLDLRPGFGIVAWRPLLVAYSGGLALIVGALLFGDIIQSIPWVFIFLLINRVLFLPADKKTNRKAKDVI